MRLEYGTRIAIVADCISSLGFCSPRLVSEGTWGQSILLKVIEVEVMSINLVCFLPNHIYTVRAVKLCKYGSS